MPHRASIYNVRIHPRFHPKELRVFGDYDLSGSNLARFINGAFQAGVFRNTSDDNSKSILCESSVHVGDEVHSTFAHGESGMVADIVDSNDRLRIRQELQDTQLVRCASLFRLEPDQKMGWWAVHVNNGRSAKGLVESRLKELLVHTHEDLILKVSPSVRGEDYAEAIRQDRINNVTLVRHEKPGDRAVAATSKWMSDGDAGTVELRINPKEKVKNGLLKTFVDGDRSVFGDILTFEGIPFDEARVQVELGDGAKRTFNIEHPDSGHAFSVDLEDLTFRNGEPTKTSLFAGLKKALDDHTT